MDMSKYELKIKPISKIYTYYVYYHGSVVLETNSYTILQDFMIKHPNYIWEKVLSNKAEIEQNKKEINQQMCDIDYQFKLDLFEEYGVTNNHKAEQCYLIADELSYGSKNKLVEIFDDIIQLIK